jgi:prevent-host-death family protein
MTTFRTADLSRRSGDLIAEALRHPVTLTQRNKPRLVMLNIEEYKRLLRCAGYTRQAHTLETMPDELLDAAEAALDAYEAGKSREP